MTQITEQQKDSLQSKIYEMLMANPEMGLGEMGICSDSAQFLVDEWMEENNITLLENELP